MFHWFLLVKLAGSLAAAQEFGDSVAADLLMLANMLGFGSASRDDQAKALAQLGEILREGQGDGAGEVTACGLFVDSTTGYLAASPDGVIDDQVTDREEFTH